MEEKKHQETSSERGAGSFEYLMTLYLKLFSEDRQFSPTEVLESRAQRGGKGPFFEAEMRKASRWFPSKILSGIMGNCE